MFPRPLAFAALVAAGAVAHAYILPPGTYPFRSYGVESGLGNLSALRIAQDSAGFLWVATQDGVYRYDGNRFRRLGLEEGLPSTYVPTLAAGSRGELWAATGAGVVKFDGRRFHLIDALPRAAANAIATDANGRLWVAMQQGFFVSAGRGFARVGGWEGGATAVWCGGNDVWAGSTGVVARLTSGTWTRWTLQPRERIDSVVVDTRGRVWARSGNHLWSMDRDGHNIRDETAALPATSNNGYLSLDARGELWVPTDRGVAVHDARGWRVIGSRQGLPTEWARDVFEDREGSIWIASLGIHRMLGRGELVAYKRVNGLPNEVTWCFHWARDGHLLVGTDLGLARSTEAGWSVVGGTERSQIRSVIEDDNGVLWVAGSPAEVLRIDPISHAVRRYGEADGVRGRAILRLVRDRGGAIWAATRGGGLLRKGAGEERFARVDLPRGDAEEDFRDIIEDRRGRIWATGQRGLARLADGRWSRFGATEGLRHDHVSYIIETSAGDFWIAYFEPLGLARIRGDDDRIRVVERLDTSNGLSATKIFLVGEDKSGRLWIGGGAGIDVVGSAEVEHFSTADGLAGYDTDAMAFLCDARGHVFIGTSSGFSYYVPRADPPRRQPPTVALTSTTLGAQSHDFAATFSALSYFKPDIVEYEVRLAGLDNAWQRVSEPHVRWSRLPPGDYRFEVRARLRPGAWSEPAGMSFAILPAWWQTAWARAAGVVLLALLVWLSIRWRVAYLRRRNIELQALVDQRTRELAELSVTDALTGLKNLRFLQLTMQELTAVALRRHEALSRAGVDPTRSNGDLVSLLLDLDHFKNVNDRHGHRIGDEVLVSLCALLGSLRRESDSIVRWGGEELLYLARDASRTEASVIAERIRAAVEQHQFRVSDGSIIRMTCSIGFAAYPFLAEDPRRVSWEEVLDIADICLYAAKRAGRNRWVGVVARDCRAPETLVMRVRDSMDAVVASGELKVLSSHAGMPWSEPESAATG